MECLTLWETIDEDQHTTSAYAYSEFKPPTAVFSPPHSDYGQDTDGDGLFDYLVVKTEVETKTAKKFYFAAFLTQMACGNMVDWEFKEVELDEGKQTVEFKFDGWQVYGSHIKEKLKVYLLILDKAWEEQTWIEVMGVKVPTTGWIGFEEYTTQSYSYDQFEQEAPPYHAIVINQPVAPQLGAGEAIEVDLTDRGFPTISVTFKLEKTRLENFDIDTVKLLRFEENWVELSTEKVDEDDTYVYFRAESSGLSVFAVTAEAKAEVPPQLPTLPGVPMPPLWVILLTVLAIVVVLAAVVWRYLSIKPGGKF
jgi:hypothetical protein